MKYSSFSSIKYRLFSPYLIAVCFLVLTISVTSIAMGIDVAYANDNDKDQDDKPTKLTLSITESVEVEEDMLLAHMYYEYEGKDIIDVQNTINRKMQNAIELMESNSDIKFSTENYNVYKYYPNRNKKDSNQEKYIWRGRQNLIVKSINSKKMLKLIGNVQNMGFSMQGLNFIISPNKYEEIKDSLLDSAILKLQTKANKVAKALGKNKINFDKINIDNNYPYPQPIARSFAMSADASGMEAMNAPVAAPGQTSVNLTISAEVKISD